MKRPIVAGNWKMHGTRALVERWFDALGAAPRPEGSRWVLFPPAVLLERCVARGAAHGVEIGAQTVHPEPQGAHTGEIAAEMVADAGALWTLVGHSERRRDHGESDAGVAARAAAAIRAGLRPMLCVGETLAERDAGEAEGVVRRQLAAVAAELDAGALRAAAVAYEPVWAIGTGRTASDEQAQAMHRVVREALAEADVALAALPVLYGGSVKPDNAAGLFAQPDIDGVLVGGASLAPEDFVAIASAADAE